MNDLIAHNDVVFSPPGGFDVIDLVEKGIFHVVPLLTVIASLVYTQSDYILQGTLRGILSFFDRPEKITYSLSVLMYPRTFSF
jgi:hypothetical protein